MKKDIFYSIRVNKEKVVVTSNTVMTYVVTVLALVGLVSCLNNILVVASISFVIVLVLMCCKHIAYYDIYKRYSFDKKNFVTYGSKYSFKDPLRYEVYRGN